MAIKMKNSENEEPKVYGNENFGIPDDCTKKQKFSTIKLIFYICAVTAICITGYKYYTDAMDIILPEITYDKTSQPLIYHTSNGITVKTQKGNIYNVDTSNSVVVSSMKPASKGKSLYFLAANKENPEVFDLVMYSSGNNTTTVIDSEVTDFKTTPDGRYIAYKKGAVLYLSNMESTRLIHGDVSEYYLSANNQVLTFFTSDGSTMYTCNTSEDESPVLINQEITKIVSPKDEYATVYYIKNSSLYSQTYNGLQKLISEDVSDAIMLGDTVYYTKQEEYERKLTDFFADELKEQDELALPPDGNDFISETKDLSFFDEQAFAEAVTAYNSKLLRDEIRSHFEENPVLFSGYSLYVATDENPVLVDTYLVSPNLALNSCNSMIAYKKYDSRISERPNIADITSLDEAVALRDELSTTGLDDDMFLLREGKKPFFAIELSPSMQIEISPDEKYLYCIESDTENQKGILAKYEIGQSALKNRKEIMSDATDFALDGNDSSVVMVFCGDSLSMYYDETLTHLSDASCRDFFFVDGTLFYYDEYDKTANSGNLMSIRNGKISLVDSNVSSFRVRRYNNITYIKDVDPQTGTGTLYAKDGSKIKRIDSGVGAIVN